MACAKDTTNPYGINDSRLRVATRLAGLLVPIIWKMTGTSSIVRAMDRLPGSLASLARSDTFLARLSRPVVNRALPSGETVVTVRSGPGRGLRLAVMPRSEKYYWLGTHERHVQDALSRVLEPGMRFWDIGTHIGFITLIAAKLVGESGSVTAFEPMPDTRARLKRSIAANHFANINVRECAIADSAGTRMLCPPTAAGTTGAETPEGWTPMWTLVPDRAGDDGVSVECLRLDDIFEQDGPPDVIKIDAEGAEFAVLAGGSRLFEAQKPMLIIEMSDELVLNRSRALLPAYSFENLGENHWLLT